MGFVVAYAPKLIIIAGLLIVALREFCNYVVELLGFCKEASFYTQPQAADQTLDSFQYPYMTMNYNNSCSNANHNTLIFEGAQECGRAVLARCGRVMEEGGSMECAVCLCEFERGQEVQITPNCCHVFHSECIHTWLEQDQKTCPLCRTSLVSTGTAATGPCKL